MPKVARTWVLYAATRSQWPVYVGSPCMLRKVTAFHCLPPAPRMRQSEFGCLGSKICWLSSELLNITRMYVYVYVYIYIYVCTNHHTSLKKRISISIVYIYIYIWSWWPRKLWQSYSCALWPSWIRTSPGHVRGRVLAQPHVSLAAGDADPLVRRAAGHRRGGLQRWKGLRHQDMEPKGWSHAEPWWLLVGR